MKYINRRAIVLVFLASVASLLGYFRHLMTFRDVVYAVASVAVVTIVDRTGWLFYFARRKRIAFSKLSGTELRAKAPFDAGFLIHLFMPQSAEAIVGDLEEGYRKIESKYGPRRASLWFYVQVFLSLRPIIWAWVKKPLGAVAGMAAAKGLIGHDGWIATVIEFVKRVRS